MQPVTTPVTTPATTPATTPVTTPATTPASTPATTRALLRLEVGRLRQRESRRVFDASVHIGVLAGDRTGAVLRAADLPAHDSALRVDVLDRLLEGTPAAWRTAWLIRPGTPEPHDLDVQWFAAARSAFGIHDREMCGFFVVTRSGWRAVSTGESRVWARLRL